MKTSLAFRVLLKILPFVALAVGELLAHDNVRVHPALTTAAWKLWPERASLLDAFSIKESDEIKYTRKLVDEGSGVTSQVEGSFTLADWLRQGAIEEDVPAGRCLAHFYNPLADKNEAKYGRALSNPIGVTGEQKRDSFDWAMKGDSFAPPPIMPIASPGKNEESWADTRGYYYVTLTAEKKVDRDKGAAHTMYALGKVLHLLQDLSQPEHVRNDAHMINNDLTGVGWVDSIIPSARWIENYGKNNGARIIGELPPDLSPLDWRGAGFKGVSDFWSRELYIKNNDTALSDEAANNEGDVTKRLGLAEFTNGNFVGADASYKELTTGNQKFPHPMISDTVASNTGLPVDAGIVQLAGTLTSTTTATPDDERKSIFLHKTKSGIEVTHHSMLTYRGFKTIQRGGNLGSTTQNHLPAVTINSASVLQEYHEILLKKAVEYSAGLLDYFFRGKLSADCYFDEITGKYHLLVSNVSGQPFHVGSFEVYL